VTISRLSDEKYIEANDAFVRWYGLDRDNIVGHDTKELEMWLNLEDRAKFWADLKRDGSVREVECQARNSRGAAGTLLLSAEIIEINREPHVLGFGIDITQRKQAEVELLRTLAKEKELSQVRSQFVSIVSHEFRTPLGIIQSSAEILKDYFDQLDSAERKDHLASICKKTHRMAGLMEEVLLLGSFDAGKMQIQTRVAGVPAIRGKARGRSLIGYGLPMSHQTIAFRNAFCDPGRRAFVASYFHEFADQRDQIFGRGQGGAI
jgi:PAS domain S-box-containing protein